MLLQLDFESETPLYRQIRNQIVLGISTGRLASGERLPTIRALAEESGINMMTVSKAYQLLCREGYIRADHTVTEYVVAFEENRSVSLFTPEPDVSASKVVGSGFDTLWKGRFRIEGIGICEVCLNPKVTPFVRVDTDGAVYLFGAPSQADAIRLFEQLQNVLQGDS